MDLFCFNIKFYIEKKKKVWLPRLTLYRPCKTERSHLAASPVRGHPSNSGRVRLNLHQSTDSTNYSTICKLQEQNDFYFNKCLHFSGWEAENTNDKPLIILIHPWLCFSPQCWAFDFQSRSINYSFYVLVGCQCWQCCPDTGQAISRAWLQHGKKWIDAGPLARPWSLWASEPLLVDFDWFVRPNYCTVSTVITEIRSHYTDHSMLPSSYRPTVTQIWEGYFKTGFWYN